MKSPLRSIRSLVIAGSVWLFTSTLCAQRPPVQETPADRFGDAAEDAVVLETALERIAARDFSKADRDRWEASMERILRLPTGRRDTVARKQLARAWRLMAHLSVRLDGPTQAYLDLLEVALSLDPEDPDLQREVQYQRMRKSIAEARTAEAARVRAALEAGRDPFAEVPDTSGKDPLATLASGN